MTSIRKTVHFKSDHLIGEGKMRSISLFCCCPASTISCLPFSYSCPEFHHYYNKIIEVYSQKEPQEICWPSSLLPGRVNYTQTSSDGQLFNLDLKTPTEESQTPLVNLLFGLFVLEISLQIYTCSAQKLQEKQTYHHFCPLHSLLASAPCSTQTLQPPQVCRGQKPHMIWHWRAIAHILPSCP